jgi:hypothetical protein
MRRSWKLLGPTVAVSLTLVSSPASELVLVSPDRVNAETIREWKADKFTGVVLLLHEADNAAVARATRQLGAASLPYYYWIEVGRDAEMAKQHPRWMASIGMHEDWRKLFPAAAEPKVGEVAKAYPWVPINYKEAFDAHVTRVKDLLRHAPTNHAGILLNHLQSGPSSCGCGNLQCRWATDYQVPATGTYIGDDAAAQFMRAVGPLAGSRPVIPVWTTECERQDLPASRRADGKSTGLCGAVGCATGACPQDFTKHWHHLVKNHDRAVALLAIHNQLGRTNAAFAHGPAWVEEAVSYLDETLPKNGGALFPHERLWVVVEGRTREEELAARRAAGRTGASRVIVARVALEQSFEPRMIHR